MPRHAQVLAVAAVVLLLSLQPQSAKAEDYYQVHPHSLAPCGCAPLPPSLHQHLCRCPRQCPLQQMASSLFSGMLGESLPSTHRLAVLPGAGP